MRLYSYYQEKVIKEAIFMDDRQYSSAPLDQPEDYAKDQLSFFEDDYDNKDEYKKEQEPNIQKPKKEHFSFGRFIVAP
jgi:hypothetical protein